MLAFPVVAVTFQQLASSNWAAFAGKVLVWLSLMRFENSSINKQSQDKLHCQENMLTHNDHGFHAPANIPTYAKGGIFARAPLLVALNLSLSSCSSSREFSTLSTTHRSGALISSAGTSHFVTILNEDVAWSQQSSLICVCLCLSERPTYCLAPRPMQIQNAWALRRGIPGSKCTRFGNSSGPCEKSQTHPA